jgi:hypothetical protein
MPLRRTPDRGLVRLARTAPWGAKVYLVPMVKNAESITVFGGPGGAGRRAPGLTAQDIVQGRGVVDESGIAGARHLIRFLVVVPDGVAEVQVGFVRGPIRHATFTSEKLIFDDERVQGNVVAFSQLGAKPAKPWLMTWLSPAGKVIKHIALPTGLA